ncbi:TNF receptor-associated factor 6-B isoform X2 [Ixodes scapularis]
MKDHYQECLEKRIVCIFCKGEILQKEKTKHNLQCPSRFVRCEKCETFYAYSLEKKHKSECPKTERKGSDGDVNVLNESLQNNQDMECQEQLVSCDTCTGIMIYEDLGTHKYQCPLMERECSVCGVNVLNRDRQTHLDLECQKRVVLCGACDSTMCYDERDDHDQECPEKLVYCDDCSDKVLRKEKFKHASECPMRVVYCGNCEGFYAYSSEKEHKEQCEIKKLACEYCTLELKGDDEKNAHLETCEDALIECPFKEFGCSEKKAMDTISELQQKVKEMERCNMSQQEEARNEKAKLEKRIQELENSQLEADQYRIDLEDDVKVSRTVLQSLEDKVGRISKEAATRRRVDMLNERVETYLGPLERLLNGLRDDHDQECPEKLVYCDDCSDKVLRKEKFKHASECPMRVVYCGNCEGFYAYSSEKEHKEQCEIKKLACEYCTLELKGDDEKNAHLETCEDALIECPFKEFGCSEKAQRKKMQEHENDPHNALLKQVIVKAMDTISELQQKVKEMERCNMSQQEEARNEKAKLEKRIQELENSQLEADQYRIDLEGLQNCAAEPRR